ncbi:hypothetical protein [Streptomyces sp.]|uniref:hypothetical protein n=1 Tax=Streptomyces sp. TaxID=1931 RepID=UPI002D2BBCA3|nr:hypothetical protein [Streptomyces sp.]HZF92063.1 hypothetical protein [Streptomyces sp.]
MALFNRKSETEQLRDTVAGLPKNPAAWTPEQRRRFTIQSDRAMREQNGVADVDELT